MSDKTPDTLHSTTDKLALLMKNHPGGIEKDLVHLGENQVGIFEDENFTKRRFADLETQKVAVMKRAIEDISGGVLILRSSTLGLSFRDGRISPYVSPHGTLPSGTVIFSISWKNVAAFKAWRFGETDDIPQDDINAAIYFLTAEIAQLI